jgi:formylglycine-generating enzyme required for sulfatase activity
MQALLGLQAARLQRSSFDGDAETLAKGIAVSIALARGDARSIPVAPLSPATRSANAPSTALAREKFPPRAVPPSPFSIKVDAKIFNAAPNGQFRPGNGKTEWFKDLDVGPEMVVMPAGEFLMGSNEYHSEKPQHRVTIKKPFAVGRFAITFTEWDAARLPHKPEDMGWGRGQRPVINVSRDDVQGYVNWLSQRTGKPYRLLSESEWEYCCRAGTVTQFAVGDTISKNQAQFSDGQSGSAMQTVEVGTFAPNAWGVYDMHGNVWDMCEDYWHDNYQGAPVDGSVWRAGDTSMCVLRGGAWQGGPDNVRSARRVNCVCGIRNEVIGFRVARTL